MKAVIVAEIGSNWEGSVNKAKKIIYECKKAGADAIKFQMWRAEDLYNTSNPNWKNIKKSELTFEQVKKIKTFADQTGIEFFCSVFYPEAVNFLETLKVKKYKIASRTCLLKDPYSLDTLVTKARTKKPVIISMGMGGSIKKIKDVFTRVLKGHIAVALSNIKKEKTGHNIDKKARKSLNSIGLDYRHGTGHGVGFFLNVHEGPQAISKINNIKLEEGMILSNEPGYYETNKFGIRLENLVFIKKYKKKLRFENYLEVWTSNRFQRYTFNSIIISSITVLGVLTTSIPAAYSFAKINFPFKNFIFYSLLLSLMIPEIITLLPHLLIIRGEIIPLPFGPSWMNSLQGLTVPFMGNIFVIFLLRQYFKKIPNELWDAARIDGSSHFNFLIKVVIPMSKPIIVTVALFTFIIAWNSFAWPLLILTRDDWYPVTVSIYSFVREVGPNFNLLMAACLIAISPILVLYFFTQKLFIESISNFGLKQ